MVSDDLGYLLIFIVLPTVLIVSGIWLVLFIRRDSTLRSSVQRPSAAARNGGNFPEQARASDELVEPPGYAVSDHEVVPLVIASLPPVVPRAEFVDLADAEPATPLQGAGAISIDLLYDSAEETSEQPVSDARLLDLVDQADRETLAGEPGGERSIVGEPAEPSGRTEQLDAVDFTGGEDVVEVADEADTDTPDEQPTRALEPQAAVEDASESASMDHSGNTAPLPEYLDRGDPSDDAQEMRNDDEDEDEQFARKRRQPEARLVKSTDNVVRRGRATARKIPPIARTGLRDEDAVERDDSR